MSKKGEIIQGSKFEKALLLIDVIIIIVTLVCIFFAKPLGISKEIIKYIIIFGTILVVLIGLVITGISGDREDAIEDKKTNQEIEENEKNIK